MKPFSFRSLLLLCILTGVSLVTSPSSASAASAAVLGWNNLGMHCMDSDYSVFSILPPYNTIQAQLIVNGKLVTNGTGYTVTYQALTDPAGSINRTSEGKGNFSQFDLALYGADLPPDTGLLGWKMPGGNNVPQAMLFETTNLPAPGAAIRVNWFRAEGIPITPWDDSGAKNPYPMMRLVARNSALQPIATNDIVLPVSDEMDCRACHASGTQQSAQPADGWVWDSLPERDYRLNILRLHDQHQFITKPELYAAALAARGFNTNGLYRGVVADGKPVLCAACHASEALGAPSFQTIPPLTASIHSFHAYVQDPILNTSLNDAANRAACYRCHPGSTTKCLRGVMGGAVAADGSAEMQCQSCHGTMAQVGNPNRVGWFMEPTCQSCHTGTATSNNGQIRYTSAFTDANGTVRIPVNTTFATQPNSPASGLSLYRFSTGHGGLQCAACHGSTHAEFPATHPNDNLRNERLQGHAGVTVECTACHASMSVTAATAVGGPHGLHPVGQSWVSGHSDILEESGISVAQCRACHGSTDRGTELSRAKTTRTVTTRYGTRTFWAGQQIGCYDCHNGSHSESATSDSAPAVASLSQSTSNDLPVGIDLLGTDANGDTLTYRIVSQPSHGTTGLAGNRATLIPEPGFTGQVQFTYAANDGYRDSNLGTVTVDIVQGGFSLGVDALVPPAYPAQWPAAFSALPSVTNRSGPVSFLWDFGDGTQSTNQYAAHAYSAEGSFDWTVTATIPGSTAHASGTIQISAPPQMGATGTQDGLTFTWPASPAAVVLEQTPSLSTPVWEPAPFVFSKPNEATVTHGTEPQLFYRLRQVK